MPGVRPLSGSSSTLIRNGGGESSGSQEGLYSHSSKTDTLYRSSPDLSRGSSYHQRTSSADSLDGGGSTGSYHGGHSRQSSDSVENYPTRSLSTSSRKTSVSTDPLQFVKLRGADHLAKQAEEQIRLAEQFKKERSLKELEEEKVEPKMEPVDEGDWQSNLNNWRNRRKSRSERSISVREEMEEKLRAEDAKERPTSTIKTFSQMKEERERRKSGYTSYPLNDEGDEDVFKAISTPGVFTTPRTRRVAPAVVPTESTPVEDKKVKKAEKKGVAAWAVDSDEEEDESSGDDDEEEEEDKNNNNNQSSSSAQAARQTASSSTTTPSSTSLSSPSEEHSDEPGGTSGIRSCDKEDEEGSMPSIRSRRTGLMNRYSSSTTTTTATNNGRDSGTTITTTTTTSSSFAVEGGVAGRSGRGSAAGHAPNDGSEGAGGRGQGKITDIRKQFETRRQEASSGLSRTAGDSGGHSVDVRSRTKSFERPPLEEAPPPSRPSRTSLGQGGPGSSRVGDRKDESNHSFSSFSSSSSTTTYPSSRHSSRDPVEKVIKISQNPNSEKGFGFTLSGGAEKRQPLVVERVSLGSAADVCELKVRDELISVNRRDVTKMTHPEVTQLISESVRSGQLELRVKRNLDSSKDEEEDFLSSDEEMEKLDRNDVGNAHSFDSMDSKEAGEEAEDQELTRERHWMQSQPPASAAPPPRVEDSKPSPARPHGPVAHLLEQDEAEVEEEAITPASAPARQQTLPTAAGSSSISRASSSSLAQTENKPVFEVETRPSITLRKASLEAAAAPKPRDAEPAAGRDRPEPRRPRATEAAPDSDDSGPPSILLKWQRKRAGQSGGGLGKKEEAPSSLLGSSLAWRPESASPSSEDTVGGRQEEAEEESSLRRADRDLEQSLQKAPVPGPRHTFAFDTSKDHQRMREWDRSQARERKTDPSENALEADFARDQEQFEEKQRQLQQQYQAEQQRAALAERQKQEEERQILELELERTRPLEERRKERRARLERQRPEDDQPSSLSSNASPGQQGRSSQETITVPLPHSHQPGGLVIDPRNRLDGRDDAPSFQLNIRKTETPEGLLVRATPPTQLQHSPYGGFEQQEMERLRLEEEEKRRQLEEKEARIRQEEERLRQEREELRKEQERLRREKEEMKRMGGTAAAASLDYTDHNGETSSATAFEPVSSRVRAGPLSARVTRPPVQRYGQQPPSPTASSQFSTTVVIDPKVSSQTYTVSRSTASWNQPEDRTQDALRPGNISTGLSGSRERLTREDLIAMNRKSTPLQVRPDLPSPTDSSSSSGGPPSSPSAPIVREAPNKTQLHSLNVVPKPRLRGAGEWITSPRDDDLTDQPSRRHSEVVRRPFAGGISTVHGGVGGGGAGGGGAGEHWLVEEAERRRLAAATSSDRKPYTGSAGPIKPLPDLAMGPASKWSSDPSRRQSVPAMMAGGHPGGGDHRSMPAQIRQTLLQKTAGARAPGTYPQQQELNAPPGGYSSPSRGSPALQPRGDYGGGGYEGQQQGGPLPPAGRAPPPPKEQALPVSGKQKCSHCSLELGFGAAMVIESLGLYYHVQCFRCCVCRTALGSGVEGTDVRVRVDKLHCPNCYSNDEGSAHRGPP